MDKGSAEIRSKQEDGRAARVEGRGRAPEPREVRSSLPGGFHSRRRPPNLRGLGMPNVDLGF